MLLRTCFNVLAWIFFIPGIAAFIYVVLSFFFNKEKKKKCLSRPNEISMLKAFTWVYIDEILLMIPITFALMTSILIWTLWI